MINDSYLAQVEPITPYHIQSFRCCSRSNKAGATAKIYPFEDGYMLRIEGSGAICAPRARFHPTPWGKYSDEIKHIEIRDGITEIESNCFSNLVGLVSVDFPDTLTAIYSEAFSGCSNLSEIHSPSSLEYIGPRAFYHCTNLRNISFGASLLSIESEAFAGCKSLSEVSLPNDLRKLGNNAFSHCISLVAVKFSSNLRRIASGAFLNCSRLRHIILPSSIKSIEDQAFAKCAGLETLDLSQAKDLDLIYNSAFSGCKALRRVHIQEFQRLLCMHHFSNPEISILSEVPAVSMR